MTGRPRLMPLRYRIAGTIILVVGMVLALLLWATLSQSLRAVRQEMQSADAVAMGLIGDLARPALVAQEFHELQSFVTEAMRSPRFRAILLADQRGRIVAASAVTAIGTRLVEHLRDDVLWRVRDVIATQGSVGRLAVQFSDHELNAAYWRTMRFGGAIALGGLMLVAAVGLALGRALAASEARLREIMASALDGIVCVDVHGRIEAVNEAAGRIFGASPASLVGSPIARLLSWDGVGDDGSTSLVRLAVMAAGTLHEVSGRHASGRLFPLELAVATAGKDAGRVVICTMRDITQRKRSEAEIVHHATHDRLTDLPNRSLLQDRLQLALDEARRDSGCLAVLFIDLDHFKAVNDSFGHQAGDDLLVAVAERLREAVRTGDTVARIGGDEFIVLARNLRRPTDAHGVGQKLMAAMRRPFVVLGNELRIGASAGIAVFPDHGDAPELLLRHADAALYAAKGGGRDRVRMYRVSGVEASDRGQDGKVPASAGRRAGAALEQA